MNCSTIKHFAHPDHPLLELNSDTQYLCDGCKTHGTGTRFRCNTCNFDLHEYCGRCPKFLPSFMHPHSQLTLRNDQGTHTNILTCNVCGESIEGLFYGCRVCEFEVHPICTQLPQYLRHALHRAHPLTFQASKTAGCCGVCREVCNSWRYRCGDCDGFDIHLECVLVSCDTDTKTRQPYWPRQGAPPRTYGAGYIYGLVPYGPNPYYNMYNNYQATPYNMAYANNYQVPAYNVHNYQAPGYNTYNAYVAVPSGSNPYNMAYANNYQAPAYNVHNYQAPGYNTDSAYVGVPSGSNPYNTAHANNYQVPAHNVHNYPNQAQQPQGRVQQMFSIVSQLALGVLSNVIFGIGFADLI